MLQGLRGPDIIGADVVCLMPTKDSPNQITAQVAMVMMFELASLIASRHMGPKKSSALGPGRGLKKRCQPQ